MSSLHLVNIWTDPDGVPGGFNPMAHSLFWLPEEYRVGQPRPAFIFVHRWGGYPHDDLAQTLGPHLAERGFGFLAVCMRRRGVEGQLMALPDNDVRDLKLAVDYLTTNGFSDIYLIGEEVGAWSVLNYHVNAKDSRVKGICLVDPVEDLPAWLQNDIGSEDYAATVRDAGVAARQGAAMDYRIDCFGEEVPDVSMQAGPFLAWWGPMAATRLSELYKKVHAPTLIFAESEASLPDYFGAEPAPQRREARHFGSRDQLHDLLSEGAWHVCGDPIDSTKLELVNVETDDCSLYGFLWEPLSSPEQSPGERVAVLLMHGLTSSPTSVLFQKMAPVLAQEVAVLAMESHRSGWSGHETALLDDELQDFDAWIEFLVSRGYDRVVLAGASMGSLSIGRYYSLRQPEEVFGLAHLMPTADCPDWFRAAAGDGPYAEAAANAEQAMAENQGDIFLVDVDVRQPPPSLSGGRFRWTQNADSWLSWWGPDADSRNSILRMPMCPCCCYPEPPTVTTMKTASLS